MKKAELSLTLLCISYVSYYWCQSIPFRKLYYKFLRTIAWNLIFLKVILFLVIMQSTPLDSATVYCTASSKSFQSLANALSISFSVTERILILFRKPSYFSLTSSRSFTARRSTYRISVIAEDDTSLMSFRSDARSKIFSASSVSYRPDASKHSRPSSDTIHPTLQAG